MTCGRSAPVLILNAEERSTLERLIVGARVSRAVKQRSRTILACAEGKTNMAVGSEVGLTNLVAVSRVFSSFGAKSTSNFGLRGGKE
jgi:hypothetical protein